MNKTLLVFISLMFLAAVVGRFTTLNDTMTLQAQRIFTGAECLIIILMLINGTFISTPFFKIACFILLIFVLGSLFKVMHLVGASEILLFSFTALIGVYSYHFWKKQVKRRIDILKLVMVLSFCIISPVVSLHLVSPEYREVLAWVNQAIFGITFLDFLYASYNERTVFE